ncbi:hypothetical protein QTO02_00220 [Vibrio fortis]
MTKKDLHREMSNAMHIWSVSGNTWGCSLREACLPVCMGTIEHLKSLDANACIVIGDIAESPLKKEHVSKIKNYPFNEGKLDFEYHAWFELGNGDILDLTGAKWLEFTYGIKNLAETLDRNSAKATGFDYFPVITSPQAVQGFYEKLKKERGISDH